MMFIKLWQEHEAISKEDIISSLKIAEQTDLNDISLDIPRAKDFMHELVTITRSLLVNHDHQQLHVQNSSMESPASACLILCLLFLMICMQQGFVYFIFILLTNHYFR